MYLKEEKLKKGFNLFLIVSNKDLIAILEGSTNRINKFFVTDNYYDLLNLMFINTIKTKNEFYGIKLNKKTDRKEVDFKNIKSIFSSYEIEYTVFEQYYNIDKNEMELDVLSFEKSEISEVKSRIETRKEFNYIFKRKEE